MNTKASPLGDSGRLNWIDAARGLAILGIFMVNVPAFNAPYFLYGGQEEFWSSSVDQTVQSIVDIFFQASFYTLFSFMFGFGIQMMKDRLEEKGIPYMPVIYRRLFVLTGFGMVHAFLIWHGDILLSYGVLGLILPVFFQVSPGFLLGWAFGLLGILTLPFTLALYVTRGQFQGSVNRPAIESALSHYGNGSLFDIWQQNLTDWQYANAIGNLPFLVLSLVPMFLLGMYVCRKRWLHEPDAHRSTILKVWVVTGILFVTLKAGPHFYGNPLWFGLMQDGAGGSASAIFYVLSITLLFRTEMGARLASPLVWVGRMSLSNYILQSVFCFVLFYSAGFGLYGQVSPAASMGIVILFYIVQVFLSRFWLKNYRYGPLEWLWRTLTYGQKQPNKRRKKAVS